jgi:hypothetical protein
MDKKAQFDKERGEAKTFLKEKLGRDPTAAEILALMGSRRKGLKNEDVIRNITRKASERKNLAVRAQAAAKEAAAAARKAVREEAKAKKEQAKVVNKEAEEEAAAILAEMNEEDRKTGKKVKTARTKTAKVQKPVNLNAAAKSLAKKTMKAMKNQAKEEAKLQREMAKKVKEGLSAQRKQLYKLAEEQAKKDLAAAAGKNPRMANIKRLAAIRTSGANISAKNFLQVRNYRNSRKTAKRVNQLAEGLQGMSPDIDVCAACDYKRWLEKEE